MTEEGGLAPGDVQPAVVCEGGHLDCGSGLLLLIRKAMSQVPPGVPVQMVKSRLRLAKA